MRFGYSISEDDVRRFVSENACVREFLNQYDKEGVSYQEKAVGLCRFFCWFRTVKGLNLGPSEFLNLYLKKRGARTIAERARYYSPGNICYVIGIFRFPVPFSHQPSSKKPKNN